MLDWKRGFKKRKFKLGLALGGGAARGLAHLGVLRVLEEEGLRPDLIAGTSVGAIIGAMYASDPRAEELVHKAKHYIGTVLRHDARLRTLVRRRSSEEGFWDAVYDVLQKGWFIGKSLAKKSLISEAERDRWLQPLFDRSRIEDLSIPLVVLATDLVTGKAVVINKGDLFRAVSASVALPGIFPPVEAKGKILVDGGMVCQVPSGPVRMMGADVVIAVDVSAPLDRTPSLERGIEIMLRTHAVSRAALRDYQRYFADVFIVPDLGDLHWADPYKVDEAIAKGEDATKKAMPEIIEAARFFKRKWRKLALPHIEYEWMEL